MSVNKGDFPTEICAIPAGHSRVHAEPRCEERAAAWIREARTGKVKEAGDVRSAQDHLTVSAEAIPAEHRAIHGEARRKQRHTVVVAKLGAAEVQDSADMAREQTYLAMRCEAAVHEYALADRHPGRRHGAAGWERCIRHATRAIQCR